MRGFSICGTVPVPSCPQIVAQERALKKYESRTLVFALSWKNFREKVFPEKSSADSLKQRFSMQPMKGSDE